MARVNGLNTRMRVRTTQDLAVQHPRQPDVRSVGRIACDFLRPVRPDRALANDVVFFLGRTILGLYWEIPYLSAFGYNMLRYFKQSGTHAATDTHGDHYILHTATLASISGRQTAPVMPWGWPMKLSRR
jgi:hypothetical protein